MMPDVGHIILGVAALAWAAAWWDVNRRAHGSTDAASHAAKMVDLTLSTRIDEVERAFHNSHDKTVEKVTGALEEIEFHKRRLGLLEQSMKDMTKAPVQTARAAAAMPFGRRA